MMMFMSGLFVCAYHICVLQRRTTVYWQVHADQSVSPITDTKPTLGDPAVTQTIGTSIYRFSLNITR